MAPPTFIETWDESKPAGSRALSLGDDDLREFKRAIRERLAVDHKMVADESGVTTVGYHLQSTFIDKAGNPIVVSGAGILFSKTVSGVVELCYMDSAGVVSQITTAGVLNSPADSVQAKTGDWMLSSVATARGGWTNVSATYSNKFIRINATPLTTGGVDTHLHSGASHTHAAGTYQADATSGGENVGGGAGASSKWTHTHSVSGTSAAGGTGDTGSSSNVPAYVQAVIFQKN